MKGGKRLTEEELRAALHEKRLHDITSSALDILAASTCSSRDEIIDHLTGYLWDEEEAGTLKGRDDAPEYCTCGHAHGMHSANVWACDDCGKPVKGE
jgi:hypothetical protein